MKYKFFNKIGAFFNCIALMLVIQGANTACVWIFHQPDFPEQANKYKRIK